MAALAQKTPAIALRNGEQHAQVGNLLVPIGALNSNLSAFLTATTHSPNLPKGLLIQFPLAVRFKDAEWSMGRKPLQQGDAFTAKLTTKRADVTAIFMPEPPAEQVGLVVTPHLMSETDLIHTIKASANATRTRHPEFQVIHGGVTNPLGQRIGRFLQLPDSQGQPVLSVVVENNTHALTSPNDIFVEDLLARLNGQRSTVSWRP